MLVQPAVIASPALQAVFYADSRATGAELQVLKAARKCGTLSPAFHPIQQKNALQNRKSVAGGRRSRRKKAGLRLAAGQFRSLSHNLLQLALNVGVADVLIFEHSIGIDRKRSGNHLHAKLAGNTAIKAAIAILWPIHAVFGYKITPLVVIGIQTNAENHQGLLAEAMGDLANMRQRSQARTAPGIDQHGLSGKAVHGTQLAIEGGDRKRRGHPGPRQLHSLNQAPGAGMQIGQPVVLIEKCGKLRAGRFVLVKIGQRNAHVIVCASESGLQS